MTHFQRLPSHCHRLEEPGVPCGVSLPCKDKVGKVSMGHLLLPRFPLKLWLSGFLLARRWLVFYITLPSLCTRLCLDHSSWGYSIFFSLKSSLFVNCTSPKSEQIPPPPGLHSTSHLPPFPTGPVWEGTPCLWPSLEPSPLWSYRIQCLCHNLRIEASYTHNAVPMVWLSAWVAFLSIISLDWATFQSRSLITSTWTPGVFFQSPSPSDQGSSQPAFHLCGLHLPLQFYCVGPFEYEFCKL